MVKLLILIIILFVNIILVGSEDTNSIYNSNDPEVISPSKEGVEHIFDLMIVIILYMITEKIPLGIAAALLNFLFQVFVCTMSYFFIIRAYNTTNDYFFIQYLITYSVFTLFVIPSSIYFLYRAIITIKHLHYYKTKIPIAEQTEQTSEESKHKKKLKKDQLKHMYYSFSIQITIYITLFIAHLTFFIIAFNRHYVFHLAYWVILLPSLIFIVFTIIEVICAAIFEIDEITELKDLEERVKKLEESKESKKSKPNYGPCMNVIVDFHDRIKNRIIMGMLN
ncbi:26722_t:CDS:1 [Dentiscutata erythropus]|uniref:26722_t:CDS:1 n=1 Tax=Dentiscutata erythropus TaxID=1348616 RepID=A0A9N9G1C6_9GLOM|nr:26722_t:CDS:1 [Dentiscutata erythropus]